MPLFLVSAGVYLEREGKMIQERAAVEAVRSTFDEYLAWRARRDDRSSQIIGPASKDGRDAGCAE